MRDRLYRAGSLVLGYGLSTYALQPNETIDRYKEFIKIYNESTKLHTAQLAKQLYMKLLSETKFDKHKNPQRNGIGERTDNII